MEAFKGEPLPPYVFLIERRDASFILTAFQPRKAALR